MRILFLTHRLPYAPNRGDRIRAYYSMREMAKFSKISLFALAHSAEEHAKAGDVPFADDVQCVRIPRVRTYLSGALQLPSERPLTHILLDSPDAVPRLTAMVKSHPPDLVVAFNSGMARFAFEPPLLGRPLVVDIADVDSVKWAELANTARIPLRWIYEREARTLGRFEADAAMRAGLSLVCAEREREVLLKMAPGASVTVIENGIDLDAFRPPDPPQPSSTVVFCGVMNYEPNRQAVRWFAEHVWPLVVARRPDARFVVVGSSPTRDVRALTGRFPSVDVVGRVPTVQPYLWRSAVAVAPLLVARGVQNKVLEALAAGLPTVVTSVVWNGLPLNARRGCLSVDDPREFADAVIAQLNMTPAERRLMVPSADVLESLTWSHRFAAQQSLFEHVVQSAR